MANSQRMQTQLDQLNIFKNRNLVQWTIQLSNYNRCTCLFQDKDLWATYENGDLDSELRVAAYLALMRCPSEKTMGKMAASLVSEEDDNVGAFVYSHLSNLRKTSDPHRQDTKRAAQKWVFSYWLLIFVNVFCIVYNMW